MKAKKDVKKLKKDTKGSQKTNQKDLLWGKKLDDRIAEMKKMAVKNDNHLIFILTSSEEKGGLKVEGMLVSNKFSAKVGLDSFLSSMPEEVIVDAIMRKMLGLNLSN